MQDTDIITEQTADKLKAFNPSTQAFYDLSLNYPNLPDDIIEIDDDTHARLLTAINSGCHILPDLTPSAPKPSSYHIWQNDGWVLGVDKSELQAQVWEAVKQKRHTNIRSGVYIKSVGKWFHNDDSSRTQYLALQVLPSSPPDLMWKTMDNSFVPMTKDLLNEIAMTMLTKEQSDFANAEKHLLAMLQADNPLEYDYSTGWSETYLRGRTNI